MTHEEANQRILALWLDDPAMLGQDLDYGQISDMTGLDLIAVVVACRSLVADGRLEVAEVRE